MLIGISLMILIVLVIFSLIFGETFISVSGTIGLDNTSLLNGSITTYEVPFQEVVFDIDPLVAGIAILIAVILVSTLIGSQILGTGLSPASVRVIIIIEAYAGLWTLLSLLAINLIKSIAIFGNIIYIVITIGYTIGVFSKFSGGDD